MLWKFCHDFDIFATLSISLDVWRIFVCVFYINVYVNEYTVACNEWNSVSCNTTTRRLFCFMCVNQDLWLDNNIQKAATFHTSVEPFRRSAR